MPVTVETVREGSETVVRVAGAYGQGSGGNEDARRVLEALDRAVANAAGRVVLDMSGMTYEWGDAIGAAFVLYERDVQFVLNRDCAAAWNGILSMVAPNWSDDLGNRIRFRAPPSG